MLSRVEESLFPVLNATIVFPSMVSWNVNNFLFVYKSIKYSDKRFLSFFFITNTSKLLYYKHSFYMLAKVFRRSQRICYYFRYNIHTKTNQQEKIHGCVYLSNTRRMNCNNLVSIFFPFSLFFFFKKKKKKIAYGTWGSRVIPHPSTNQACGRLSSEFGMGSPAWASSMAVYNIPYVL